MASVITELRKYRVHDCPTGAAVLLDVFPASKEHLEHFLKFFIALMSQAQKPQGSVERGIFRRSRVITMAPKVFKHCRLEHTQR